MKLHAVEDRLKFVVDFAYSDLSAVNDKALSDLRDAVARFLAPPVRVRDAPGGVFARVSKGHRPPSLTPGELSQIQDDTRTRIEAIARAKGGDIDPSRDLLTAPRLDVHMVVNPSQRGTQATVTVWGSARDTFHVILSLVLITEPTNRLLVCADEACDRVFLRIQKRKFCQKACTTRHSDRKRRGTPAGKEADRVKKRRRYQRRGFQIEDPTAEAFSTPRKKAKR